MSVIEEISGAQQAGAPDVAEDWWRGAVIYQIYPRSYQDSTGDGIGDLNGIIERLPHVASLGVDAIWISPFFLSPMRDFGYDVADYRQVDPMFGTMDDFDRLVERAHGLGIRVMIDLVLSHTSSDHPWFIESRSGADTDKADWYVWADPKPDGSPPNNWLSIFGGSAWHWNAGRMQYYLHNFLIEQPDLNLHNPQVQDAVLDVARFWLDRGVDGFRLDTINFYFHDQQLRDNPPLDPALRNASIAPEVNLYNWQSHLYDKNQPENLDFLRRLRQLTNQYPGRTIVGEVGDAQHGMEIQAEYTSGGDKVHMCYDFTFLSGDRPDGSAVATSLATFEAGVGDGWACWAFSNHDVVRHPTRWSLGDAAQRVYLALLCSLRGSVCLYQGEELGLPEADVAFDDLQDPYGKEYWPEYKGRDGCRTPMPWVADNRNGGFSQGAPWLPMAPEHLSRAVSAQEDDLAGMLTFTRAMLAFRAAHPALARGALEIVDHGADHLVLIRRHQGRAVLCAFNLSDKALSVPLPDPVPGGDAWQIAADMPFDAALSGHSMNLPAYQALFAVSDGPQT